MNDEGKREMEMVLLFTAQQQFNGGVRCGMELEIREQSDVSHEKARTKAYIWAVTSQKV